MLSLLVSIYRDRKRKKFVRDGDKEGQKRVKTESGSYVPSSYKAGLYPPNIRQRLASVLGIVCLDSAAAQIQGVEEQEQSGGSACWRGG